MKLLLLFNHNKATQAVDCDLLWLISDPVGQQ